jgi:hypothetical protein
MAKFSVLPLTCRAKKRNTPNATLQKKFVMTMCGRITAIIGGG